MRKIGQELVLHPAGLFQLAGHLADSVLGPLPFGDIHGQPRHPGLAGRTRQRETMHQVVDRLALDIDGLDQLAGLAGGDDVVVPLDEAGEGFGECSPSSVLPVISSDFTLPGMSPRISMKRWVESRM